MNITARLALALPLVLGVGLASAETPKVAPDASRTTLADGRILILGGTDHRGRPLGSAGILDPRANVIAPLAARLGVPRARHTATMLPEGRVLVLGGIGPRGEVVRRAEVFSPSSQHFEPSSTNELLARAGHTVTVLTDGKLLVVGGVDDRRLPVPQAEIFDPGSGRSEVVGLNVAFPRQGHRAFLLADGRVLILGGRGAHGQKPGTAHLYDPARVQFFDVPVAEGQVLLRARNAAEPPSVAATVPTVDAAGVSVKAVIALRFSKPLRASTLDSASVTLLGPEGVVPAKVVPAEVGMLAFVTPERDLLTGTRYNLFLSGALDPGGASLPLFALGFDTEQLGMTANRLSATGETDAPGQPTDVDSAEAGRAQEPLGDPSSARGEQGSGADAAGPPEVPAFGADEEDWKPGAEHRGGRWRSNRKLAPEVAELFRKARDTFARMRAPRASRTSLAPGETAISGFVVKLNGRALGGVAVSVGGLRTTTDSRGRFTLAGVPAGTQALVVDGRLTSPAGRYGQFILSADVTAGEDNELPHVVWMPRVDVSAAFEIPSPTPRTTVLRPPHIPGLEIIIPKGTIIRDREGNVVTRLTVAPVPLDAAPFPVPENFPVYFTIQPGGGFVQGLTPEAAKGIRVIYPNYSNAKPGTVAEFWDYDPYEKGWYVYGQGRVSADGRQVVPDPGVAVYRFMAFSFAFEGGPKPPAPVPPDQAKTCAGDPVDCGNGIFHHSLTDLHVQDILPITITRTYRTEWPTDLPFGKGSTHPYAAYLYADSTPTYIVGPKQFIRLDVVLPDGTQLPYLNTSGLFGYGAVFEYKKSGTQFQGSRIAYNGALKVWDLRFRDGSVWEFATVDKGAIVGMRDRASNRLRIQRTAGRVARITSPGSRYVDFSYDAASRVSQIEDNLGRVVRYEYFAIGDTSPGAAPDYLKKVTWQVGYGGEPDLSEEYTYENNRMKTVKDRRGNIMVTNEYDAAGRTTRQTLADAGVYNFDYVLHPSGAIRFTTVTDPNGHVRRIEYDEQGLLLADTVAFGTPIAQATTYARDAATDAITRVTDHRGRTTAFGYDTRGNVARVTRLEGTPEAVTEYFEYTPDFGQLEKHTDPRSQVTRLGYDDLGRLIEIIDPLGHRTTYTYNGAGQATSVTRGAGTANEVLTAFSYDVYDLRTVSEGDRTTTYTTDAVGRAFKVTDGRGNVSDYDFDHLGRLRRLTDPLGGITQTTYDGNGNLTELKDPGFTVTSYSYDPRNRVASRTDPFGKEDVWSWDGNGNLVFAVDRRGQRTDFAYDALDRRTLATHADAKTVSITYDYPGLEAEVAIADEVSGAITQRVDALDRLKHEITPQGRVDYGYDPAGRRTSMEVQGQSAVSYGWDDADRLTGITREGQTITLSYDEAGRRQGMAFPNGVEQRFVYDASGRPRGIRYYTAGILTDSLTDTWDGDGRPIVRGGSGSFPRTGLPAATAFAHDRNRLVSLDGSSWTYDDQGNLADDGARAYVWDARNRLIEIQEAGTTLASFAYDALDRRISRTVTGSTIEYFHDGPTPVREKAGPLTTEILTGPGIDEYLARFEPGRSRHYLTDLLGSTVALTDELGNVATSYTYEPYGETSASGEASTNPFQYTGRENDGTGLHFYRARYYHPRAKRFIAEDPIGQAGGANPYPYVGGNPLSATDPTGEVALFGGVIGGVGNLAYQLYQNGGNWKCVNGWEVAAWALTGSGVGMVGRGGLSGISNFLSNSTKFRSFSRSYWDSRGGANGMSLDHWMIPQSAARNGTVSPSVVNGGWNLLEMPAAWNRWLGFAPNWAGNPQAKLANATRLGIQVGVPGVAVGSGLGGYEIGSNAQQPQCGCK